MSVRTLSRVWECSTHRGTDLLVLLAIADFADDDGRAYPSVVTLARKCRMSQRNANYILSALAQSGELDVKRNAGPSGANRYRITLPLHGVAPLQPIAPLQCTSRTPATHCRPPLQRIADKPSLNRQEPVESHARASRAPAADQGSRLPRDWTLPDDWRILCRQMRPELDPDAVAEDFRDFWVAKPAREGKRADWLATWKRWVRNERAVGAPPKSRAPRTALHADDVIGAA